MDENEYFKICVGHGFSTIILWSNEATEGAQEASSSVPRNAYHVFLSFRGADIRTTFIDHLYTALVHAGIRTFRDDNELERGENIESELNRAIQQSRISIIVFSKNYATSSWCLNELVQILEQRRNTAGHTVLPIFYHVDPSHVRHQIGRFAEAFAKHEERFKANMDKVRKWRAALKEVADLSGMNLGDGHEAEFIQEIIKWIGNQLNRTILNVAPYPIGIDSRVENINLWLQDESNNVGIMAIYGMGGIGKTTIAKAVYNQNFEKFEGSSFLANIRDASKQPNGLVHLQKQLLRDILKGKKVKIYSVDEGIIKIKDAISWKRILIVLDDVDKLDQLNAVLGMRDWLFPGSKIIITSRHKRLLKAHEAFEIYKVAELDGDESLQLFCWHAFGQDHPIDDYLEYSQGVLQHCGGLPLALQVLGSSLCGTSSDVWASMLKKLEEIPDNDIIEILKISYDSLKDDHDKNLFLDIACFFVGEGKDHTITILDECDFCTAVGIHNLIDRCLLTIDEHDKLMMHQLIRDMGREIVRRESNEKPGERSRVWRHKDALKVLREKTGTEKVKGLILNLHMLGETKPAETFSTVNNEKRHNDNSTMPFEGNSSKRRRQGLFSWLPINSAFVESFSTSDEVDLKTDAFSSMHKIKILQLNYVRLTGDYKEFPKMLRWLCWRGFPLKSVPKNFDLANLIALDLRNSSLEQVWRGTKFLRVLKILNLSYSATLTSTPNFLGVPNLERLIIKYCVSLFEIHKSIGNLGKLVFLNLEGCKSLRKLPESIGKLKCLEKLILIGCSKLDELPTELGKMESLAVLHADGINQLSLRDAKPWHARIWPWVSKPEKSPKFSLQSLPFSLVDLSLQRCNLSDDAFPKDLSSMSVLQKLNLSENPICGLPESIKGLNMLHSLELKECKRLRSLPALPLSLQFLTTQNCTSLERISNLPNLSKSLGLTLYQCEKLVEVEELFKLEAIENFDREMLNNLGFFELESIQGAEVTLWNSLAKEEKKAPIQGLQEFGILSTFLPGSNIPSWFNNKNMGPEISFEVPSHPNLKIRGLSICAVYEDRKHNFTLYIKIINRTKDLKWFYGPTFLGIPEEHKNMLWLSHWKFGDKLECGDQVCITFYSIFHYYFKVTECGVRPVYDDQEKSQGAPSNSKLLIQYSITNLSYRNTIDGDLWAYQLRPGAYFLSHSDFDLLQQCHKGDGMERLYKRIFGQSEENTVEEQKEETERVS